MFFKRAPAPPVDGPEFREFLVQRVEPIPGWLHTEASQLTGRLVATQRALGLMGPTLEIGVYKGKYLSVLHRLSRPDEPVVGVDLFVGAEDAHAVARSVADGIRQACGDRPPLEVLVADSTQLTAERLRTQAGVAGFRFISVDGGHTREIVESDLALAAELLQDGGIIALDDAFNHTTPGVIEGIAAFFILRKPRLAPFAHCYNKLFVTTPGFHAAYLEATKAFVADAVWLPTHERTTPNLRNNAALGFTPRMFGYEIVPFL